MLIPMRGFFSAFFLLLGTGAFCQNIQSPFDTLVTKGLAAIQAGEIDPAKDFFYAAMEVNPEDKTPYYMLGYCYTMDCYERSENCDLGISFLNKAILIDRYYRYPFYNRAICKFEMGDLNGALADVDAQIELDSTDPDYFFLRADIYFQLDNREGACADLAWLKAYKGGELYKGAALIAKLEEYCRE